MRGWQRLSWPDKIGIIAASAVAVLCVSLGAMLLASVGTVHVPRLENAIVRWSIYVELAIALPLWLLLRAIDAVRARLRHLPAGKATRISVGPPQLQRAPSSAQDRDL